MIQDVSRYQIPDMQAMSHQQQDGFKFQALAESHDLSFLMCPVGDQIKLAKGIIALKT